MGFQGGCSGLESIWFFAHGFARCAISLSRNPGTGTALIPDKIGAALQLPRAVEAGRGKGVGGDCAQTKSRPGASRPAGENPPGYLSLLSLRPESRRIAHRSRRATKIRKIQSRPEPPWWNPIRAKKPG